jgi:hypothetical protein
LKLTDFLLSFQHFEFYNAALPRTACRLKSAQPFIEKEEVHNNIILKIKLKFVVIGNSLQIAI